MTLMRCRIVEITITFHKIRWTIFDRSVNYSCHSYGLYESSFSVQRIGRLLKEEILRRAIPLIPPEDFLAIPKSQSLTVTNNISQRVKTSLRKYLKYQSIFVSIHKNCLRPYSTYDTVSYIYFKRSSINILNTLQWGWATNWRN